MLRSWTQWLRGEIDGLEVARRDHARSAPKTRALEDRCLLSNMVFTVNSAGDDPTGPTAGVVTLRDALMAVNSDATDSARSPDVINFAITGPPTINLLGDLPAITKPVTINGSTRGRGDG